MNIKQEIDRATICNPYPWQIPVWYDRSPIILLTGTAGGGKSWIAAEKLNALCKRYPGSTGLALRKAREFARRSIIPFMLRTIIGNDNTVEYAKSEFTFNYSNSSKIYVGGMKDESQRQAIRSIGGDGSLDWVLMEEGNAFERADLDEVLARMRGKAAPYTQIIIPTNSDSAHHWINQDLIIGGEASVYYSSWKDNPANPPGYEDRLNMLKGVRRARLRDGLWVAAEGAVFEFDPDVHIIDPIPLGYHWPRFRSIDYGVKHPTVVMWWAVSPTKKIYCYRELVVAGVSYRRIAAEVVRLTGDEEIVDTFADHDAGARLTFVEGGIDTSAAIKDVLAGIDKVNDYLAGGPGQYQVFFFRDMLKTFGPPINSDDGSKRRSVGFFEEAPAYVWAKRAKDELALDKPVKEEDDSCDTARYFIASFARHYADGGEAIIKYAKDERWG